MKPKLLILQTHPIQYYAPIYRELARQGTIDIVVLYLTDAGAKAYFDPGFNREVEWDIDLLSGYRYQVLQPGTALGKHNFWGCHDSSLTHVIEKEKPDWIMLYGYASRMNWAAWWYARKHGIRILYTSDSNARIDIGKSRWRDFAKKLLVQYFFRSVDAFLSPSDANREYLLKYGAAPQKISGSPLAIDVGRFSKAISNAGKPRQYSFVWAGKLIDRKRCQDYLAALAALKSQGLIFRALLVGDGPAAETLASLAKPLQDCGYLHRIGFANQAQMPTFLANAEALVFTSEQEPYGLIATEAAACGCALVAADTIGCVGSLGSAQPGKNTWIYPTGDVAALSDCMRRVIEDQTELWAMQSASLEIAEQHDITVAAKIIGELLTRELA